VDNFEYIQRIYDATWPFLDDEFPVASNETEYETLLIEGFDKVVKGLRVCNTLSSFEKEGLENLVGISSVDDSLSSMNTNNRSTIFDSYFAIQLSNNAVFIAQRFQEFTPDQNFDLYPLFRELIQFYENYLESQSRRGHIEGMIERAFTSLAISDLGVETQISALAIRDFQDPSSEQSESIYESVLKIVTSFNLTIEKENEVSVRRFFVGYLLCIVATDDDVHFITQSEHKLKDGEWDDTYKYGEIYRNDKREPDTRAEWFGIMSPNKSSLFLGERTYKTVDDAIKYEKIWMNLTYDAIR